MTTTVETDCNNDKCKPYHAANGCAEYNAKFKFIAWLRLDWDIRDTNIFLSFPYLNNRKTHFKARKASAAPIAGLATPLVAFPISAR